MTSFFKIAALLRSKALYVHTRCVALRRGGTALIKHVEEAGSVFTARVVLRPRAPPGCIFFRRNIPQYAA